MPGLLLVEDNPDDEALALRAIKGRQLSVEVQVAHDGQEAVEALGLTARGNPPVELPSGIVLDLKLPKLSGHEVLERVRSDGRTMHLPVLVLSSSEEPVDVERATRLGAWYMRKPDDFYEFVGRVGEAIERLLATS